MEKSEANVESFTRCMSQRVSKLIDRAICILYFYSVVENRGASLNELTSGFVNAGLGNPNITRLRSALAADKRTTKTSKDSWRLKADRVFTVESQFQLAQCLDPSFLNHTRPTGLYVDATRLKAIEQLQTKYDLTRLIRMLHELDHAFAVGNYITVILLMRSILDHVPPLFGFPSFKQLVNNYAGTRSFKDAMKNLEDASRKIADSYLHTPIRQKESLPNKIQVNFSHGLDVLLAEIIRIQ